MTAPEFKKAVRQDAKLLIFLAGGSGSGKTESAMRLASGLAGGKPFACIDTENGRALHKADDYEFMHAALDPPFSPERYAEAITAADDAGFPVLIIDSGSHEYEGIGGVLDIQREEFERMGKRDSARMSSWIAPKRRHIIYRDALLRSRAHVIVCHRATDKVEIGKDAQGKTVVRPKESLTGADGWIPISERRLPFEATISLLLTADAPGVPKPIKRERRHQELVPLDQQLDEKVGQALAKWAAGGSAKGGGKRGSSEQLGHSPSEEEAVQPVTGADNRADANAPASLTAAQFKRMIAAEFIGPEQIKEAAHRLFPAAKSAAALTDEERGELFAALLKEKQVLA
jgi:hypothetical protein